jgi:nicotinate dehydrogenase subunit A
MAQEKWGSFMSFIAGRGRRRQAVKAGEPAARRVETMTSVPSLFALKVNGRNVVVEADPKTPLLYILRNDLELNGPKYGCGLGECGTCCILMDGRAVRSCTIPIAAVARREITTLEGLGNEEHPHPVQQAFIEESGAQCGYCLNGMIISSVALLGRNPDPQETDIREALRHNLCRCGTHIEILAAVRKAVILSKATSPASAHSAVPETQA